MKRNLARVLVTMLSVFMFLIFGSATTVNAAGQLISVDLQSSYGSEGRNFSGVDTEAATASPLFAAANVWNHIGTTGFDVTTDVSGLVDSTGSPTTVGFKTSAHGAYGASWFGPSNLLNDYFYWDDGYDTGPVLNWEIYGLVPGETYVLFLNGSNSNAYSPRQFLMRVDTDGDGDLFDETETPVVSPPGTLFADVVANATGKILGMGIKQGKVEPNWGGFQLAVPPVQAIPTLSEWGMILFSLLMAAAAFIFMRRRNKVAA